MLGYVKVEDNEAQIFYFTRFTAQFQPTLHRNIYIRSGNPKRLNNNFRKVKNREYPICLKCDLNKKN